MKVAIIEYFLSDNQRKIEEEFTQEAIAEKSKTMPLRQFTEYVQQQLQTFIDEFTLERMTMIEQRYKKKKPPQSRGGFSYQKNSMLRSNGRYIRFILLYFNLPFSKPIFRRTRFFSFCITYRLFFPRGSFQPSPKNRRLLKGQARDLRRPKPRAHLPLLCRTLCALLPGSQSAPYRRR